MSNGWGDGSSEENKAVMLKDTALGLTKVKDGWAIVELKYDLKSKTAVVESIKEVYDNKVLAEYKFKEYVVKDVFLYGKV